MLRVVVVETRILAMVLFELFLHLILVLQLFIELVHWSLPPLLGCPFLIVLFTNFAATLLLLFDLSRQKVYKFMKIASIFFLLVLDFGVVIHMTICYIAFRSGSLLTVLIVNYVFIGSGAVAFSLRMLYDVLLYNQNKSQQSTVSTTYSMHRGPEPSILLSSLKNSDSLQDHQPAFSPNYEEPELEQTNETELNESDESEYEALV